MVKTTAITITDVAKKAGVSISTVSRVINRTNLVSEDLRERVLKAIEDLDFKPSLLAQNLRGGSSLTNMVAVIVPDLRPAFFSEALTGIQDYCSENNRMVYVCNANSDPELELLYAEHLRRMHVEGVVFLSTWGWDNTEPIEQLLDYGIPVVVINRNVGDLQVDQIYIDRAAGNYMAVSHLLDLGHRRIGAIAILSLGASTQEEITGYRTALQEAGLPYKEDLIVTAYPTYSGAYEAARRLLTRKDPPTAIFARSDAMAIGAIRAALDLGLRVPQDISIIGFGNIDIAQFLNPPLTTVQSPIYDIGLKAASLLLERVDRGQKERRQMILHPRLIIRGTTAQLNPQLVGTAV